MSVPMATRPRARKRYGQHFRPDRIIAAPNGNLFARSWRSIYRSIDNGLTWQPVSEVLPDAYMPSFELTPAGYLFAGTSGRGLYRSSVPAVSSVPVQSARGLSQQGTLDLRLSGATVSLVLARPGDVTLGLYDLVGREVASIDREDLPAGQHRISLAEIDLAPGVYLLTVRSAEQNAGQVIAVQ